MADLLERHLARLEDPSLPPVVHDWAGGSPPAARPAILRRIARSRWTGSALLVLLGAVLAFEAMRFFAPPGGSGQDPGRDDRVGPPAAAAGRDEDAAPRNVARAPDVEVSPAVLPPGATIANFDESRLVQAYRQSFLDKQYDFRRLRIAAPGGATNLVRPDPRGVRITIPAKFAESVAIETKFAIHGDFDLRAGYEILAGPPPRRDSARARGAGQASWRLGQDRLAVPVRAPEGHRLLGGLREESRRGDEGQRELALDLRQEGHAPAGPDRADRALPRRRRGHSGIPTDLSGRVRDRGPGDGEARGRDGRVDRASRCALEAHRSPGRVPPRATQQLDGDARAVALVGAGGRRGGGGARRDRGLVPGRGAATDDRRGQAGRQGGHDGRRRVGRRRIEEARGARGRLCRRAPRDGGVHRAPQVRLLLAGRPASRAIRCLGAARQGRHEAPRRNWEEVCEKLPKRFEGGYRDGRRNGVFLYHNGSGKPLSRRYRDGEWVQ